MHSVLEIQNKSSMPAIHTTSHKKLVSILQDNKLKRTPCNKFIGNKYTYLYYGRANYKNGKKEAFYDPYAATCVLIFESSEIADKIERIFPFDSGGHKIYIEDKKLPESSNVDEFDLGNNLGVCDSLIKSFWGTKKKYFDAYQPKSIISDVLCETYSKLISPVATANGVDDRASAIELVLNKDVELSCLKAIILPSTLRNDANILKLKNSFEVDVFAYDYYGETSEQLYRKVKDMVKKIFKESGVFNGKL